MPEVLLFSSASGSRMVYTLELVFRRILGCSYVLTQDFVFFREAEGIKIYYGNDLFPSDALVVPASGLLEETGIRAIDPTVFQHLGLPCFFGVSHDRADLPFDLFSLCFYLVSRYEEYLPFVPDVHGRFPSTASLAARENFLELPLADLWVLRLAGLLKEKFPDFRYDPEPFSFLPTIDIDMVWAYLAKPLWKQFAGLASDLYRRNLRRMATRLSVWTGKQTDPFDTCHRMLSLHRAYGLEEICFLLFSRSGSRKDPNTHPSHPKFSAFIQNIADRTCTGIHPSYRSMEKPDLIATEKQALETVCGNSITKSRQHFIRFRCPATLRELIRAGIREDYSMGYPDATGFRAGICRPFHWFDLERNEATELVLYPFQIMDVTLKQYLGLNPDQAKLKISALVSRTRDVGGLFVSIWHNSSFAKEWGWEGWEAVYEHLLREAAPAETINPPN